MIKICLSIRQLIAACGIGILAGGCAPTVIGREETQRAFPIHTEMEMRTTLGAEGKLDSYDRIKKNNANYQATVHGPVR